MRGSLRTTEAKARELRPLVEKFLTAGKAPTLANRRALRSFFPAPASVKIFELAADLKNRPGGYTRVIKTGSRRRDSARMAILEIVK